MDSLVFSTVIAFLLSVACGGGGESTRDTDPFEVSAVDNTQQTTDTVVAVGPTSPDEIVDDIHNAAEAVGRGDYEEARALLEPILTDGDYGATAAYNLGVIAHLEDNTASAVRFYERALNSDPTMAPALVGLVRVRLAEGDLDGAAMAYSRARTVGADDPALRAAGLEIAVQRGNYEQVISEAREILLHDEGNIDAHLALARAYHRLEQIELAKLVLRQAIERAPDRADLHIELANIYIEQDNEVDAIGSLEDALDADPDYVDAHNNLGVLLNRARNHTRALEHLQRAVELAPEFVEAHVNLSNALKADGQLVEAEQAIRRAIQMAPRYPQAYFNLGLLYLDTEFPGMTRMERLEAALDNLNQYRNLMRSRMPPDDPVEEYIDEVLAALEVERELESGGGDVGGEGDDGWDDGGDDGWDDGGDDGWDDEGDEDEDDWDDDDDDEEENDDWDDWDEDDGWEDL